MPVIKKSNSTGYFLLLFLTCFGCANLKNIHDFASDALAGAQKFETLPVSYQSLCLKNCEEQDIKSNKLNGSKCDCTDANKADSVDELFYRTMNAYLDGLKKLSDGETTDYKFDDLSSQLSNLHVSAVDADAYAKLGGILTKALTVGYRRNKLKVYIKSANEPLQVIITHLRTNIGTSLILDLNANKSKLESDYLGLVRDSKSDDYKQRRIIQEFYALNANIEAEAAALKCYARLLQIIADGHQHLTENLDKPDEDGLKDMLSGYASNIRDIRTEMQILNKK